MQTDAGKNEHTLQAWLMDTLYNNIHDITCTGSFKSWQRRSTYKVKNLYFLFNLTAAKSFQKKNAKSNL